MSTTTSTFKLYKTLIFETVKNETHIAAHALRATDKNAAELAFQEEAGDEKYHERKLERSLYSSLDKIKAEIIDYLNTESDGSNNMSCTIADDEIKFTITLSSRFNTAYLNPIADLISKYVEDSMLFEWWTPINANNAKTYAEKAELARLSILKCFIKNAPSVSVYSYANVTGSTSSSGTIAMVSSMTVGKDTTDNKLYFTTNISSSNLVCTSSNTDVVTSVVTDSDSSGNYIEFEADNAGTAVLTLYNKNDTSVYATCVVTVK